MKKELLDTIKKRNKAQKRRRRTVSIDAFDTIYYPAINLAEEAFYSKSNFDTLIYNNTIVNIVTTLEVYLKLLVVEYTGRWQAKGYDELLKDKITVTLIQAFDLFALEKITREFLITHFHSFQNFENINRVFSELTGESRFFTTLNKFKSKSIAMGSSFSEEPINFLHNIPDWERKLTEIFEIRNKFIHQGIIINLTYRKLEKYCDLIHYFQSMIDVYFYEKFDSK